MTHAAQEAARKVVFCMPFLDRPHPAAIASLEAAVPLVEAAGWAHGFITEVGNPYISAARAVLVRKAMSAGATVVVFLDYDVSYPPEALLALLEAEGDVVAGTYRTKRDDDVEEYMGACVTNEAGIPLTRDPDGAILAERLPAGFLKITRAAVERFMRRHPELVYGSPLEPHVDLFNHGAHQGMWWGEDYAFSRRWREAGGQCWIVPDLDLVHHRGDRAYPGNFHRFLLRQPGGRDHVEAH